MLDQKYVDVRSCLRPKNLIEFSLGTSFLDLLCFFFCLAFAMPLWASVYICLVVTCWESADLLALVCGV